MNAEDWRARAASPVRWLGRAFRVAGYERHAAVQALKAGLAATIAWLLAAHVINLPQPFLAPYAAVLIVEATVYRSLLISVQQVATVALGVFVAWLVNLLVPTVVVGLPIVVVAGLLVGRWRRFGDNGVWVALTALLVLTFNTADHNVLLLDRLGETVLGVAVGAAVNAVLFPPTYRNRARTAARELAAELAELLSDMADALRLTDDLPSDPDGWVRRAEDAASLVREADTMAALRAEGRRMNLRDARLDETGPAVSLLRRSWPHVRALTESVHALTTQIGPVAYPDLATRTGFADLFACLSDAMRLLGDEDAPEHRRQLLVRRCDEQLDELERRANELGAAGEAGGSVGIAMGMAGLALPIRRVLTVLG